MQILTPQGYQDINNVEIGSPIIGKGGETNILLDKRAFDKTWFEEQGILDEWKWYLINGTYKFCGNQNIYVILGDYNLCHVSELQVGWRISDLNGNDIEIVSIVETDEESVFWKLDVSNDHSFITQDIEVHNASRYWVGGGSSVNWNATGNTNWSATSGVLSNASVPGATDDVIFDGAGASGNTNATISAITTILSFTSSVGYTATITRNAALNVANNVTIHKNTVWDGASGLTITSTSTITANGFSAGDTFWSNDLSFSGGTVKTLVSSTGDIKIGGTFSTPAVAVTNTINSTGVTFTINGLTSSASFLAGTARIVLSGGTWSGGGNVQNSLDLAGNVTISGTVVYNTGTLRYVSGTITTTGSTLQLQISAVTLNCNGMTWDNIILNVLNTGLTVTLSSNLKLSGNLTAPIQTSGAIVINGFNINVGGNFTSTLNSGRISGTSTIIMDGNGTLSTNSVISGYIETPLTINTAGTITLGTTLAYRGTFTHTAGTVTSTGNTLLIRAASTFTINNTGFSLNNVTTTANTTFAGTNGFTIAGTYTCTTAGVTHTFASTRTYSIATLILAGTGASKNTLKSGTGGSQSIINLTNLSTNYFLDVTDINGSGGAAGWTFGGTLSNTSNWNASTILYWVGAGSNWASSTSWSPYSGGVAINITAFQPAVTDNVAFDVNSTGNCVIAAAAACNNLDMTGYSAARTWTVNSTLTSAGNITFQNQFTITTASGTPILAKTTGGTITVGAGGFNWPHNMSFVGAITYTLVGGNLTIGSTLSALTSGNATLNGVGLTINVKSVTATAANIAGTAKIKFITSGGVWAGQIVSDNVEIAIPATVTPDLTWTGASKTTGTVTYISGNMGVQPFTVRSTVSFVNISAITFSSLTVGQAGLSTILTADGDITATTFTCTASSVIGTTALVSSTGSSYVVYCSSIAYTGTISSTSQKYSIVMNGTGTISPSSNDSRNAFNISLTIDTTGTITSQTLAIVLVYAITYIKGNLIANYTGGPSLSIGNAITTIDTNVFEWTNLSFVFQSPASYDHILLSDLRAKNLTISNGPNSGIARFRNSGGDIYVSGNLTLSNTNVGLTIANPLTGTSSSINMIGSGFIDSIGLINTNSGTCGFNTPLIIDTGGKYVIRSTALDTITALYDNAFIKSGIFTLLRGKVEVDANTKLIAGFAAPVSNFTNMHRIPFNSVFLVPGNTYILNEFFCGKPGKYCIVSSTNPPTNVTINFTDGFEKFSRFCLPANITIANRGQIKLLSSKGNRDRTNLGFTYFEGAQPYGIPHNNPIVYIPSPCYGIGDSPADPNFF